MTRILVAVDDSPAGLAAAAAAVEVAARSDAEVRFVHVLRPSVPGGPEPADGRASDALLRHVADLAVAGGVAAEAVRLVGEPARELLEAARSWSADLVVIGRSDVRAAGAPYVGKETREVLEFAEQPVLVVPRPAS